MTAKTICVAIVCCILVLSLVTSTGLLGTNYASASSERDEKPHDNGDHDSGKDHTGTCPSQSFLTGPDVKGAKKILDISYIAQNDEDSGVGSYWALDHFKENAQVWQLPDGSFYALKKYDGIFVSPQGGANPADSLSTQTESSFGDIDGGYVATFSGSFTPGTNPTHGNIGTFNLGGTMSDVLLKSYATQKGDLTPYDWTAAYFTGVANFNEAHWGWSYKLDPTFHSATSVNQWCNYNSADGGNSGDIKT